MTHVWETRTRNSCELTHMRNLYVCHTDLQQDISLASFSRQIEHVLFRASFSCVSHEPKIKFSHTHYRALGLEMIPVYRQSAHMWLQSFLAVGCHYFTPGLRSPSQPKNVTVLWLVTSYTAWWQRHIGVNNMAKVPTQLFRGENWTHNLFIASPMPYRYATAPSI